MIINQTPTHPETLLSLAERVKETYQELLPAARERGKAKPGLLLGTAGCYLFFP